MAPHGPVFVITGQLAAGKSTVARALLDRFAFGYHVDVDALREMVTSGLASPLAWTEETSRQFRLAVDGAAALGRIYSDAGFAVVIEGGLDPAMIDPALEAADLSARTVVVVLHPRLDVALQRNRTRATKSFDTTVLEEVMRGLDSELAAEPRPGDWPVIDNSDEPVEATVDRILALSR